MKKTILIIAAIGFIASSLSSCVKCGKCSANNAKVCTNSPNWTESQFNAWKSDCTNLGYTWTDMQP